MFKLRLIQFRYILFQLSLCILPTRPNECLYNSTQLRTRVFEDLLHLQANKNSFVDGHESYSGNDVIFKEENMLVIPKNAFVTYGSNNIRKISLDHKHVRQIEDGAFYELNCLAILDLSDNKITTINKRTFEGLGFLREMDLSNNCLADFQEETFTHLPVLRKLFLANNMLQELKPDSFFKLWLLEELDLSDNYITRISGGPLQYFKSLVNFQLGSNEIDDLNLEHWENGHNLKILNVSDNALEGFDMSIKYSFRRSLTELYLNNNYLTQLFTTGLKPRFPALNVLDINDNFWSCSELSPIVEKLNEFRITHHGNNRSMPNIDKIACDRTRTLKGNKPWKQPIIPQLTFNTTKKTIEKLELSSKQLARSLSTMEAILLSIVVLALIYIVINISIRTRCYRWIGCRRRGNYTQVENVALVTGRYQST